MSSNAIGAGTTARTTTRTTQKLPAPVVPGPLMGPVTQRFFREGEDHEATRWEHAQLPPDDAAIVDPEADFDSFDRIPRKRNPALTMTVLGAGVLVAGAVWWMVSGTRGGGWSAQVWTPATAAFTRMRSEARALMNRPTEAPAPALVAAPPAARAVEPVATPSAPSSPAEPVAAATTATESESAAEAPATPAARALAPRRATRSASAAPVRKDTSTIYLMPTGPVEEPAPTGASTGIARGASDENSPRTIAPAADPVPSDDQPREHAPLHGLVWSPTAGKLVPATAAEATTDPAVTGGEARDNAPVTPPAPASPANDTPRGPDDPAPPTLPAE